MGTRRIRLVGGVVDWGGMCGVWLVDCGVGCEVGVGAVSIEDVVTTLGRGWRG